MVLQMWPGSGPPAYSRQLKCDGPVESSQFCPPAYSCQLRRESPIECPFNSALTCSRQLRIKSLVQYPSSSAPHVWPPADARVLSNLSSGWVRECARGWKSFEQKELMIRRNWNALWAGYHRAMMGRHPACLSVSRPCILGCRGPWARPSRGARDQVARGRQEKILSRKNIRP